MRTISTLLLIFSCLAGSIHSLQAQPARSSNRELPRGEWRVYASQEQAAAQEGNNYLRPVSEWNRTDERFTAAFIVPFSWINRQVLFQLEEASAAYDLFVNGKAAGSNSDPALPAAFNITQWVREGSNQIEIRLHPADESAPVESWRSHTQPAVGNGWVMSQPTLCIRDAFVRTQLGEDRKHATAEVGIIVKSYALNPRTSRIHYELFDPAGGRITGGTRDITLDMRREDTIRFLATVADTLLWQPGRPVQCTLRLKTQHEGRFAEYIELPVGLRDVQVDATGEMQLNGVPVSLHAATLPPTATAQQIEALREAGFNAVKLNPGSVRPGLYDDCDRLGMLVIAQAPIDTRTSGASRKRGGNPSNDPAWRDNFIERVTDSYYTAKRHPSVVAFSIAEASANGICLYESYLRAKQLGDPRPFIYRDGGNEWNNDPLQLDLRRE